MLWGATGTFGVTGRGSILLECPDAYASNPLPGTSHLISLLCKLTLQNPGELLGFLVFKTEHAPARETRFTPQRLQL